MADSDSPGLLQLFRQFLSTLAASVRNRGELAAIELREEQARFVEMFLWATAALFLAMAGLVILTGAIIFLFREDLRIYAAIGFGLFYLAAALAVFAAVRALVRNSPPPFSESIEQLRKDRVWLDSLK